MLEALKQEVYEANMQLPKLGLVTFTWGDVSGIDREKGLFVIKPSGVDYGELKPSDLVVVNLQGEVVEGELNPSSDTPTHTVLYNAFPNIGGVVHTHSPWAVAYAAAQMDVPAMNTTHADTFQERGLDYEAVPASLVSQHGPFAWGPTPAKAVYNAKVLEVVAEEDYHTAQLTRASSELPQYLLDKHYLRKHGASAYYGQNNAHSKDHAVRK